MGVIKKLFGHGGDSPPPPPPRDVAELVAPVTKPAVQLLKARGDGRSYFGGRPMLTAETPWPAREGKPLTFLACVDLVTLAQTLAVPWLPASGRLLFFYDTDGQPWGFDPKDRGGWAVLHSTDESAQPRQAPGGSELRHRFSTFHRFDTYPSWQRPEVQGLRLSDAEGDELIDLCSASYGHEPHHQIGGFPSPIQGDEMELECQLVSNGVYCGDSSGYSNSKAAGLRAGAQDWRLLLQFDSDDDLAVMWGDVGTLYFWIREQDGRDGRFDNVWVVLQCH